MLTLTKYNIRRILDEFKKEKGILLTANGMEGVDIYKIEKSGDLTWLR